VDAHVAKAIVAKPKFVQISTAYGQQMEGSATFPRNKYTEVRPENPSSKEEATRSEFKHGKFATEAIVSECIDKGELRKRKAEQEKQSREQVRVTNGESATTDTADRIP
jgi:ParB family transcriptional regulator, chromosome partitioning protein